MDELSVYIVVPIGDQHSAVEDRVFSICLLIYTEHRLRHTRRIILYFFFSVSGMLLYCIGKCCAYKNSNTIDNNIMGTMTMTTVFMVEKR